MERLGLWGGGTPFASFSDFASAIEKAGVGAMELLAMDMKARAPPLALALLPSNPPCTYPNMSPFSE